MPAGILKRASAKFSRALANDGNGPSDGNARARAGSSREKEPVSSDAVVETQTIEYEDFHSRLDAVFKSLDGGVPATRESCHTSTRDTGEAWRPRSTSVFRRGANVEDGGCEDEDETGDEADDGEGTSVGMDAYGRNAECRIYREDLDCLESDEEGDDDQKKMGRLRESVGRCKRLDKEDDFDANDLMAMGVSVYDGDDARDRRVRFDAADRDLPKEICAIPVHVSHPERFTRYELDEALTVGGGSRGVTPRTSARNELPMTPNIHEEVAPTRETIKPRFSKAVASRARDAKTKTSKNDDRKRKASDDAPACASVDAAVMNSETVDAADGETGRASRQRNARRKKRELC